MSLAMNQVTNPLLLLTISITTFVTAFTLELELQLINDSKNGCNHTERAALLFFKKGIKHDPTKRLTSWHGEDCCLWRGITCSKKTGHVIELDLHCPSAGTLGWQDDDAVPIITDGCQSSNALRGTIASSLLSLAYLEHLDLSMNCLLDSTGTIPEFMGSMKNLRYLNLSGIPFIGEVPPQLGNLSKLQYLDLGAQTQAFGDTDKYLYSGDITWLTNQKFLQYLSMSSVNLSGISDWPNVLNMIPSLRVVDFSYCSLDSGDQLLPEFNLTKLEKLDLSFNIFNHTIASCWFWKATSLKYLSLQGTRLFGELHDALENMSALQVLDLKYKTNIMVINGNFDNLCNLKILDLSSTWMNGDIAVLLERLPPCGWNRLQELHLPNNNFNGTIPNWIGNFTSLITFDLSANKITGSIPKGLWSCTSLKSLDLSINNIVGPLTAEIRHLSDLINLDLSKNLLGGFVPTEIGAFTNLTSLQLSNNNFSGVITEAHFAGLTSLKKLDLSFNKVKVVLDMNWLPPFMLKSALFASCQMGPLFPAWLQRQPGIIKLDISSNDLIGEIPSWFWPTFSETTYIDLSNNKLSGILPAKLVEMDFAMVNLSSNLLTGPIPQFPRNITTLDISSNSFSGTLPSFEAPSLEVLLLYSNQIGGRIPESFCTMLLFDLDLSNNYLEGEFPHCFCTEIQLLNFLLLSNNSFSGQFPSFLQNCTGLMFLDLAWNNFYGTIPSWIGVLTDLQFLRLSHNAFSGNIPSEITTLGYLQYLDLSSNKLSGVIPWHLQNLTAMTSKGSRSIFSYQVHFLNGDENQVGEVTIVGQFGEILSIITKGRQLRYGSPLAYFVGIDLSENSLIGEIPLGITSLDALISLNLSSNHLSGKIPSKIGALQSLESLDLSENKLCDEIPSSLSNLTSLSYLNLSYNSLSGRIPSGRQLDTLNPENPSSMYIGNSGLCGPPLLTNCSGIGLFVHYPRTNRQEHGPVSFYLGLLLGLVVGLGTVFWALFFMKTWRIAYFRLIDMLYDRTYVFVVLKWASLTRKEATE